MKNWRIVIVGLLSLVLIGSIACNPFGGNKPETTQQLVEVVRGDLTVTVSGSGNIEISNEIKLAFGVAGRIDKLYVEEGDNVSEGEVLARLETNDLELALTQAQVAQTRAEVAVTQAQVAVTKADLAVATAEYELSKAQDLNPETDILRARAVVNEARTYRDYAKSMLEQASTTRDINAWTYEVATAEERLRAAEVSLNEMLSPPGTEEVAIKKLQLKVAQQSLEMAQQSLALDQQSLKLAGQSVEQAHQQLGKATITAPFGSIVASVPVDEKNTVATSTTIIHLVDPGNMELKVQVDEIDIPEIKAGQRAIIEVDALPALPLEGRVSFINLLPTEEAGVTVYDVKIRFDMPDGIGLRVGMSATADIIIAERKNVLLVPDRAIKQNSQGNHIVEVMVNGQIVERTVVIGTSDGFQTEVIDGLKEREVVVERRAEPKSP